MLMVQVGCDRDGDRLKDLHVQEIHDVRKGTTQDGYVACTAACDVRRLEAGHLPYLAALWVSDSCLEETVSACIDRFVSVNSPDGSC